MERIIQVHERETYYEDTRGCLREAIYAFATRKTNELFAEKKGDVNSQLHLKTTPNF